MPADLGQLVVELKREDVLLEVRGRIERNDDPVMIVEELRKGMTMVGDRYQADEYFLAELMLSADIFRSAIDILEPHLAEVRRSDPLGKVIMATMKGDIHDLGKNIVVNLLMAHGFEVHDLGVDVEPALLVRKVEEHRPDFIGFSVLITTAFDSMKAAADLLQEAGLRERVKLMIGGGVTTPELMDYIGADFQTRDATEGVEYCQKLSGGSLS